VATDGGNASIQFDPFLVQIVRVVDSSNNEYSLEAVTPNTDITSLSNLQFGPDGSPITAMGELMHDLGLDDLSQLSYSIRSGTVDQPRSPSWVKVYRELVEWATLYSILKNKDFGTDTIVVFDGLLRSVVFAGELFQQYLQLLGRSAEDHWRRNRRKVFIVGVAKHSKVLDRYRLAMSVEGVLTSNYPAYVEVPPAIEERAYKHVENARVDDFERQRPAAGRHVGGKMFLVKFGNSPRDPIWPVDIFAEQAKASAEILGHLQSDALNGFPIPMYPRSLQRAHENAALVDFDLDIIQDEILKAVRGLLGDKAGAFDASMLLDDVAELRYL